MAENDKYADEILSDEQLENVVGGSAAQFNRDVFFFNTLIEQGINIAGPTGFGRVARNATDIGKVYESYGITVIGHLGDNEYKFQGAYSYANHPRHAALGLVLSKVGYPGYSGEWWNLDYTREFISSHIGSDAL